MREVVNVATRAVVVFAPGRPTRNKTAPRLPGRGFLYSTVGYRLMLSRTGNLSGKWSAKQRKRPRLEPFLSRKLENWCRGRDSPLCLKPGVAEPC